jgi:maleate isomerase
MPVAFSRPSWPAATAHFAWTPSRVKRWVMTQAKIIQRPGWQLALDERPARWRIGLIALASDHTTERDFARMSPGPEVAVYVNRIANANPTTVENLRKMQPRLSEAASLILPEETLDVIAYSCTSASVVIGDAVVAASIRDGKPGVPCVTPGAAAAAAFEALSVTKISILTPYTAEVSEEIGRYFTGRGLDVRSLACFGMEDDRLMARVKGETIVEAARDVTDPEAEALFISCTALRGAEVAQAIEDRLGKPVVTSNQAMYWRALRIAGCTRTVAGHGRLLTMA